jgi:hypothetical protein
MRERAFARADLERERAVRAASPGSPRLSRVAFLARALGRFR